MHNSIDIEKRNYIPLALLFIVIVIKKNILNSIEKFKIKQISNARAFYEIEIWRLQHGNPKYGYQSPTTIDTDSLCEWQLSQPFWCTIKQKKYTYTWKTSQTLFFLYSHIISLFKNSSCKNIAIKIDLLRKFQYDNNTTKWKSVCYRCDLFTMSPQLSDQQPNKIRANFCLVEQ